jgi:hypothetical protein
MSAGRSQGDPSSGPRAAVRVRRSSSRPREARDRDGPEVPVALAIPATDDSRLDMTPMIDIVFQLILFFLFNLRFKYDPHRFEATLPRRGLAVSPDWADPLPTIRVTIHPRDAEVGRGSRLSLAGRTWDLPASGPGGEPDAALEARRDAVRESVRAEIADVHASFGLPGQIDVSSARGATVAHGDVMLVLDAFWEAKVLDVKFQGVAPPR